MTTPPFNRDKARRVCAHVADGKALRAAPRATDASWEEISDWRMRVQSFRMQLARARQLHAETLVDEIIQIARGLKTAKETGAGDIAKAKLRIDTLKWVIAHAFEEGQHEARKPEGKPPPERIRLIRVATGVPRADD